MPLLACAGALGAACADYDATVRARAPSLDDAKESRCNVVKDHSRPLIVVWPASARGDLEVRMKQGVVAVRYIGCAMEVLDRCNAGGAYRYVPFTPKEDRLVIRDSKDLFANLPMGAASLQAKLERLGEIDLGMTLVGKYETDAALAREEDLHGDCSEATHVVTGLTVGAFALSAGGTLDVAAGRPVSSLVAIQRTHSRNYNDRRVVHVIDNSRHNAYRLAAEVANDGPCDLVSLQREFISDVQEASSSFRKERMRFIFPK